MEELKPILTKKKVLKSNVTKLSSKISSAIEDADSCQLELFETKVKTLSEQLSDIFQCIFSKCDEKDIDLYTEEQQSIQESLDTLWLTVNRKNAKAKQNSCGNAIDNTSASKPQTEVKLPKLVLPTFNGSIEDWLSFYDLFKASVHDNVNLSDCQKLQYLKSACKNDAQKIIQSIPISDSNYEIALNLLQERFSNKRELIHALIKKLVNIPSMHDNSSSILQSVDIINECIQSLKVLKQEVSGFSEVLIVYLITEKLDKNTRCWWERTLKREELGTLENLITFLKDHARTIQHNKVSFSKKPINAKPTTLVAKSNCVYCKEEHSLQKCSKFLNLHVQKRIEFVRNRGLCWNCLSNIHRVKTCKSSNRCRHCFKFHNSLLHLEQSNAQNRNSHYQPNYENRYLNPDAKHFVPSSESQTGAEVKVDVSEPSVVASVSQNASAGTDRLKSKRILLCTALVKVRDSTNNYVVCRALLDTGSEASYITSQCVEKLRLKAKESNVSISCLGSVKALTSGEVNLCFRPHFGNELEITTSAFVIDKITENIPYVSLSSDIHFQYADLKLADPLFYKSQPIDILLGVNVFLTLLNGNIVKRNSNLPFAIDSKLGWIIAGSTFLESNEINHVSVNCISTDNLVQKFWDLEQIPTSNLLTVEEKMCEAQFEKQHKREKDGRYIVKLPFKPNREVLGNSKRMATHRFLNLEKRLISMPEIYTQYKDFMNEYISLGHMEEINNNSVDSKKEHYYIPHHYVLRESSLTTKLRVVFDASAKSSSGVSLNDTLLVGPKVQDDLFFIVLRFRCHNIAITADLQKMYRQVRIDKSDRDFQRIIWRDSAEKPLTTYQLCTVTYGTAAAPYLATRTLKQLAIDEVVDFPKAAKVVLQDFYVDDVLTGAQNIQEGIELINQLSKLLSKGGFELHKWFSNEERVLKGSGILKDTQVSSEASKIEAVKVLGIEWHSVTDEFSCNLTLPEIENHRNKRSILSVISSIFDPIGWIAPFVITAKIFMQSLWKLELSWDESIPENVQHKWESICSELQVLKRIRIPRKILVSDPMLIELHAFCDASEKAYAAVIYIKSISKDNEILVSLLTAKTRVAPLKSISIPRLELCAALLLAHLVKTAQEALKLTLHGVFAWTDSTIVLSWLNTEPSKWQTFVANRVSEIQSLLPAAKWNHIKGKENPADCASRGLLPSELISHHLWWNGPQWLKSSDVPVDSDIVFNDKALQEERKTTLCANLQSQELSIISKISSFSKLQRIIAWCLRFISNSKLPHSKRNFTYLNSNEIKSATICIIRSVQATCFNKEIESLKNKKDLPKGSNIINLSPYLDANEVLRVGGRLKNSNLLENQKHPVLLPKKHNLTGIIIRYFHETYLHAAPELLLSLIRQKYWIVAARSSIRKLVRSCVTCCRYKAQLAKQIMADLPDTRVTQARPFQRVGLDFAGPFMIKHRSGRGQKAFKCYVCLFICFVTKAVHLEVVEDLSTPAFLSTLKRFIARRGKPTEIHSDCGTNFKGAYKEIKKCFNQLRTNEEVHKFLALEEVKWMFNPPRAPHFGGLWESSIKSMKYYLRRTVGETVLTYFEFSTLLTQIEACLNSRPLCPLSEDPLDFEVLTPGHFIIGTALTALPEADYSEQPTNRLDRWHIRQAIFQRFWNRWSHEYLAQLQQRSKWQKEQENIAVNQIVLIKDENLSPFHWKMGRIVEVHPGSDNKVRVVTIRTCNGIIKRPIVKLCPLPVKHEL